MRVYSIADIAASVRGRRLDLGLSQAELAVRCGVSRKWISEFEAGKPRAELILMLRVLEDLELAIDIRPEPGPRAGGHSAPGERRAR